MQQGGKAAACNCRKNEACPDWAGSDNGCTVTLTGRISTTGGAGTVSYEWTFKPKLDASQPLSQSVAAGQSAVYVTAAIEGQGRRSSTR